VGQGSVDEVGENGLDDRVLAVGDVGVGDRFGVVGAERVMPPEGEHLIGAGLAMAFKLIEAAQGRWRAVNAPHLVALVRAGATF
jgi:hypothetical protein